MKEIRVLYYYGINKCPFGKKKVSKFLECILYLSWDSLHTGFKFCWAQVYYSPIELSQPKGPVLIAVWGPQVSVILGIRANCVRQMKM